MKLTFALAFVAMTAARSETVISFNRIPNKDLDEVFSDMKTLKSYTNCLLGVEECTPEGSNLKKILLETLKNNCNQCSENEKIFMAKYGVALMKYTPEEDEKLIQIYDPELKYEETLDAFIQKYGY